MKRTCETCFWFDHTHLAVGNCRLGPPVVITTIGGDSAEFGSGAETVFPKVHHKDWCGEHSPKEDGWPEHTCSCNHDEE